MIRKRLERHLTKALMELPGAAQRALSGPARVAGDHTLDPKWQFALRLHGLARPAMHTMAPADARVELRHIVQALQGPAPTLPHVEEMNVAGAAGSLRARLYRPNVGSAQSPLLVWFHGGGFTIGDLETTDPAARSLAATSRVSVLSVQYRKAPEAPFPGPVEDAIAAWRWAQEHAVESLHADPKRMAVGGASAGANLSAAVCQRMIEDDGPIPNFLMMLYPLTQVGIETPSRREFGTGYGLDTPLMHWFMDTYLETRSATERLAYAKDPRVSPLAFERKAELPKTLVATAGFDPLRDEGKLYADAINAAGGEAEYRCFGSQIHAFAQYGSSIPSAGRAMNTLGEALALALL